MWIYNYSLLLIKSLVWEVRVWWFEIGVEILQPVLGGPKMCFWLNMLRCWRYVKACCGVWSLDFSAFGHIIEDAKALLSRRLSGVIISHVPRQCNGVAHCLARYIL